MQENAGPEMVKSPVVGAAPERAHDPRSAARAVREMFTSIAPRYDLLNHVLSFNIDRMWWRRTARTFPRHSDSSRCSHFGFVLWNRRHDLRVAPRGREVSAQILGADFSHAMLQRAAAKSSSPPEEWVIAESISATLDRSRCSVPSIPQ